MGPSTTGSDSAALIRDLTDAALVRAHQEGDVRAFEELHRRYVGSIYRLVRRKLGDGLLAEDIAQETFLKSLKTMHKVDENFNFGGWIHTVARNLCLDELRRRQRDPRVEDTGEGELLGRRPGPAPTRSSPTKMPSSGSGSGRWPACSPRSTAWSSPCASCRGFPTARS